MSPDEKKPHRAEFRFYAELNDFLRIEKRQRPVIYAFRLHPTVKDAIEALGVPHPEVDLVLVNGKSVTFGYHLQHGDYVSVYPEFELLNIAPLTKLRPEPLRIPRFVADVNLGKLAKKLRLLGWDTVYRNDLRDEEIVEISLRQKRTILTRDQGLLKIGRVQRGYWVRSNDPHRQTAEVVAKFDLAEKIKPFSRCLECNNPLQAIAKYRVDERLLPGTRAKFKRFNHCPVCGKIYWQGSHYQRMLNFVERMRLSRSSE